MSHVGISMGDNASGSGSKPPRHRRRSFGSVLLALLLIAGLGAALFFGGRWLLTQIQGEPPADYPGPGSGSVIIEVLPGNTVTDIGNTLAENDVVASGEAFVRAARRDSRATSIQPGAYDMLNQMSAEGALERLLDPSSRYEAIVRLPEGLRIDETVSRSAEATGLPEEDFWEVLTDPDALELPPFAPATGDLRAEGFLFPATYTLGKNIPAAEILQAYVERFNVAAIEEGLYKSEELIGYDPYDVLIIASLVQAEGLPQDFSKVARVIYNRLDESTWGETFGYLQLDATLNYALEESTLNLSNEQLRADGPYNTYTRPGLPPTPINSPGQEAINAALNPADGDWLYYVTVNPDTGQTNFTNSYSEFLIYKEQFQTWCRENADRC